MAQASYGTITVTDMTDITGDYIEEALQSKLKYIWINLVDSSTYPAGTYAASGRELESPSVVFDYTDSNTYGFNSFLSNSALKFRYNSIDLTTIGVDGLKMYTPIIQDNKITGSNLSTIFNTNGINFYNIDDSANPVLSINTNGIQVGKSAGKNLYINNNGFDLKNGNISIANFGITANNKATVRIGETSGSYITISDNLFRIWHNSANWSASFGYVTNTNLNNRLTININRYINNSFNYYLIPVPIKGTITVNFMMEFDGGGDISSGSYTFTLNTPYNYFYQYHSIKFYLNYNGNRRIEFSIDDSGASSSYKDRFTGAIVEDISFTPYNNQLPRFLFMGPNTEGISIGQQVSVSAVNTIPNNFIRVDEGSIRINNSFLTRDYLSPEHPIDSKSITHGSLFVNGRDMFGGGKILWHSTGGYYITDSATADLNEPISAQPHGIILAWSNYNPSTSTPGNQFFYQFIPKYNYYQVGGYEPITENIIWSGQIVWYSAPYNAVSNAVRNKYLAIYDDSISSPEAPSGTVPYNKRTDNSTYFNNQMVLRYVIGI